jgi:hypothetical protein
MTRRLTIEQAVDDIRDSLDDMGDADIIAELLKIVKGVKTRVVHPDDDDADQGQTEIMIDEDG